MINQPPPPPPFPPDQEPDQHQSPYQQAYSPSLPDAIPPKKKNNGLLYGVIGVALFSMCAVVVIAIIMVNNSMNSKVNAVFANIATALVADGTITPIDTAPSYADYRVQTKRLTGAEQDAYTQGLIGKRVENWQGIVVDVVKKLTGDGYEIRVDLDHPRGSAFLPEVSIDVSKAETLQVTAGQDITFSGTIRSITCIVQLCPVELDQATFSGR
jgi:hypothetical protein